MGDEYSIKAILSAVDQGFTSGLDAAAAKAKSFGEATQSSMKGIGVGMTAAGGAITAMGVKSLKSFGDFQQSLNTAAVVAGGTSKDIQGLSDVANKMGADLPLDAQACSDAMIEMARNGASVGDIKKQFPAIAEAATAAGSDIKATAGVVQESMNIWGDSLKSPEQAAAILVQTANASNASIEDMQQALATIGGSASQAGMSMQVTSEAIGLLTNKGFSAAQASMDLNHAIVQMLSPSKQARAAMSDLNISFTDAQGNMKKFPDILRELNSALDGLNPEQKAQKLKAMFGTAGMQAMVPLLDSIKNKTNDAKVSWDAYAREQDKVSSSTKAAKQSLSDQASEMQKNIGANIEQLGGNWEALRNKAMSSTQQINGSLITNANNVLTWAASSNSGTAQFTRGFIGMMPSIGAATTAVGGFILNAGRIGTTLGGGISAISNLVKTGSGLVSIATGAKTVNEALGTLAENSKIAAAAQGVLNAATSVGTTIKEVYGIITGQVAIEEASLSAVMLASPITWIVAGIIAVVAALTLFFTQTKVGRQLWSSFINWLQTAWNGLVQVARNVWNSILKGLQPVIISLRNLWNSFNQFFKALWSKISGPVTAAWNIISTIIQTRLNMIKTVITAGMTIIRTVFGAGWQVLSTIVSAVWNIITTVVSTAINAVAGIIRAVTAVMRGDWSGAWNAIKGVASTIWNGIKSVVQIGINAVKSIVQTVMNAVKKVFSTVWDAIKKLFNAGVKAIKSAMKFDLGAQGRAIMNSLFKGMKDIWEHIKSFVSGIAGWIKAHKGPISYDEQLLIPAGQAIMGGLNSGLTTGFSDVQDNVLGIAGAIASQVNNVLETAQNNLDKGNLRLGRVNSEEFSKSIQRINGSLQGKYEQQVNISNGNLLSETNNLLHRLLEKDSTIVLDDGTLVGKTVDKYNAELGSRVQNIERWS